MREDLPQALLEVREDKGKEIGWPPSGLYISITLLYIVLRGEPDLVDALIHFLMK